MALVSGLASNAIGAFLSCVGGGGADLTVDSDPQSKRKRDQPQPIVAGLSQRDESSSARAAKAHPPFSSSNRIESDDMQSSAQVAGHEPFSQTNSNPNSSIPPFEYGLSSQIPQEPDNSPFVNHGLITWNEKRREWAGNASRRRPQPRAPVIRANTTYDELLGTSRPFSQPIPLSEMIAFLVDSWEEEGLYG